MSTSKDPSMLLTEIDHVAIAVRDLEAAIDYYRETFGCEVDHREIGVVMGDLFWNAS